MLTLSCGGSGDVVISSTSIPITPPTLSTVEPTQVPPTITPSPELIIPIIPVPVTPTPEPVVEAQSKGQTHELRLAPQSCYDNPDRFNWQTYALLVGFPVNVMEELRLIVMAESHGDLCAVNQSSGASCWIQQLPGGPQFFDPLTCMSQGYAKWLDGGQSFYRHWYQWWNPK